MTRTAASSKLPVAIYARISRDRAGAGLGVERQEADCRAVAKRLGWTVAAVYVDNDISAYSGKHRPQYRAMLEAVRAGEVRGVLAWHTDRLHRRATELEEFVSVAEAHDLQVQTVTAGPVDLTTASGRMVARMLGTVAQHEVDHARERMKRAKAQMATDGKYRGGLRPYGYESDGVTIREEEAAVLREATQALIAGRSLAGIARELNERELTTSTGKPWTYARLRDVVIRPRNAGLLSRGIPGRTLEIVGPAVWPAVVPEETWRALYAILCDPSRRRQDGNDTRWLGSGLYICGRCGGRMRPAPYGGTAASKGRNRKHLYRCVESAHLTISADHTDEFVLGVLAEMVRDPRIAAAMQPGDTASTLDRERRSALAARLAGFEGDYALGVITGAQLQKATATVSAELAEIDARLAKTMRRSTSAAVLEANDPGAALLEAPIDVQRAVLATVLRVTIQPTAQRGLQWKSERVQIEPVTGDSDR